MPVVSRRHFLATAAASLAVAGSPSVAFASWLKTQNAGQETIILCDRDGPGIAIDFHHPNPFPIATHPGTIKAFNTATGDMTRINVPFFGHTTMQDPRNPQRIASFEKWGLRGAVVDLKTKSIIASAEAEPGCMFLGHAAYIRNGSALLVAGDSYDVAGGKLMLLDPDTLAVKQTMPSYGQGPHQCMLLDDGKTLLVANSGLPERNVAPSIAWIDADTGRHIKTVDMGIEPYCGYEHIDVSFDGWVATGGFATTPNHDFVHARAALISPEGKVIKLDIPDGTPSKVLSISFLGHSGLVVMSLPDNNAIYVWNYYDQSLVANLHIHSPSGILPGLGQGDPTLLVSLARGDKHMVEFTIDGQKQFPYRTVDPGFGGRGAHLLRAYI